MVGGEHPVESSTSSRDWAWFSVMTVVRVVDVAFFAGFVVVTSAAIAFDTADTDTLTATIAAARMMTARGEERTEMKEREQSG
jgi:hypothetical protein